MNPTTKQKLELLQMLDYTAETAAEAVKFEEDGDCEYDWEMITEDVLALA